MRQNGHSIKITISANTNTLKAVLILENGYHVDFRPEDSLCSVLGFNNDVYRTDYQESENPVKHTQCKQHSRKHRYNFR